MRERRSEESFGKYFRLPDGGARQKPVNPTLASTGQLERAQQHWT